MTYRFDPRGDLPLPTIHHTSYQPRSPISGRERRRDQERTDPSVFRHKRRPCYDWIFSTSSNAHVAIDKSSFKSYTPFHSYVLTVADQRQISIRGVGTVDLNIRCHAGSKESHVITLENVLHIPGWICNIFSDIYFTPGSAYEHTWADSGVSFLKSEEEGVLTYWGLTDNFLGLEKLVLAHDLRGRSPMLEDKEREVFSVNLTWPLGQRNKWEEMCRAQEQKRQVEKEKEEEDKEERHVGVAGEAKSIPAADIVSETQSTPQGASLGHRKDPKRSGLAVISANLNLLKRPSTRTSSLKAPTSRFEAIVRGLV